MAASSAFRPLNAGLTECSGLRNMLARSTAWRTFRLLCCGGVVPVFGCCSGSLLKMVLLWCSRGFFAWFDGAWLDRLLVLGNFRVFWHLWACQPLCYLVILACAALLHSLAGEPTRMMSVLDEVSALRLFCRLCTGFLCLLGCAGSCNRSFWLVRAMP